MNKKGEGEKNVVVDFDRAAGKWSKMKRMVEFLIFGFLFNYKIFFSFSFIEFICVSKKSWKRDF